MTSQRADRPRAILMAFGRAVRSDPVLIISPRIDLSLIRQCTSVPRSACQGYNDFALKPFYSGRRKSSRFVSKTELQASLVFLEYIKNHQHKHCFVLNKPFQIVLHPTYTRRQKLKPQLNDTIRSKRPSLFPVQAIPPNEECISIRDLHDLSGHHLLVPMSIFALA